jgi:uncharacterized protein (DUF433 family)
MMDHRDPTANGLGLDPAARGCAPAVSMAGPSPSRARSGSRASPGLTYPGSVAYERVTIDPAKMRGVPCIRGLRIPVAVVIGQLAAGRTTTDILDDFPDLEADDIPAALEYGAAAVQERELPLTRPA